MATAARTAVLVIHGIGNQRPLETLRAAADAIYSTDPRYIVDGTDPRLWLTFDRDDGDQDLDLPMLTTSNLAAEGESAHYVDFHECYWAHLMDEARFVAVPLWLFEIVRKGPARMAARIRLLWPAIVILIALWLAAASYLALSACAAATGWQPSPLAGSGVVWALAAIIAAMTMGINGVGVLVAVCTVAAVINLATDGGQSPPFQLGSSHDLWTAITLTASFLVINVTVLLTVVGDAARYHRAAPANIAVRRATRKLAIDRLTALHRDGRYDRIVVVAHSLGTVIGYDMLRAYWSQICNELGDPGNDADFVAQDATLDRSSFDPAAWRERGQRLLAKLPNLPHRNEKRRWIVTDFITLGSPLTHAPLLMADGNSAATLAASFKRKRAERELPQDPAWPVGGDGTMIFRVSADRAFLHSAALFGLTRWTNLYFPLRATVLGDVVGGEVRSSFGPGIFDQQIEMGNFPSITAHTHYFDTSDRNATHLTALRAAVDLRPGT